MAFSNEYSSRNGIDPIDFHAAVLSGRCLFADGADRPDALDVKSINTFVSLWLAADTPASLNQLMEECEAAFQLCDELRSNALQVG